MPPDVSFVIAAYNSEQTIARAIDSAIDQKDVVAEVIVVDDQSTDGTLKIARSYGDARVRVIARPENGGPGAARNTGIDEARGRWIAVLDSDDVVHRDRMQRLLALADSVNATIAVDNIQVSYGDGRQAEMMFPPEYLESMGFLSLAEFIMGNRIFKSKYNLGYLKPVFERQFLLKNAQRYNEQLKIGEDYLLLASALSRGGRCVVEPMPGYTYHVRSGSISSVLKIQHIHDMIAADVEFRKIVTMTSREIAAFESRGRSLGEAASFLELVGHVKSGAHGKALFTALKHPAAVRHLKMPIGARFNRMLGR